jgi:hypothetical protein
MIKGLQGITGVTVSGGNTALPYVGPNSNNPMTGMLRINGTEMEVFNGSSWQQLSTSYATVGLDQDILNLVQWARKKRDEELEFEQLAKDDWLLIHAVHLDRQLMGSIVHNPRSNMNNSVGYARPSERSNSILLGTDGIGANMMEEARLAYVRLREFDIAQDPTVVDGWLQNNYLHFPEAKNDKVTWSYNNMSSPWHTAFTTDMHVLTVEVDGEKLYDEGKYTRMDIVEIRAKAQEQAQRLFERLEA